MLMQEWLSKNIAPLTLAPSLVLLGFIGFSFVTSFQTFSNADGTEVAAKIVELTTRTTSLIQAERGMSAGFLASGGKEFANELKQKRK